MPRNLPQNTAAQKMLPLRHHCQADGIAPYGGKGHA